MKTQVIIPFRDRGIDPRRAANLDVVQAWWYAHGFEPKIVSDGLSGDAQFNRHRAYNRAVSGNPGDPNDVFVFTEADMLIHPDQINDAIARSITKPGLVVPFTQYRYLDDVSTQVLRDGYHDDSISTADWWAEPPQSLTSIFKWSAESIMDNGRSIGAVNVMSRRTLDITGGFTEATRGNWYDDRIIEEGFAFLTKSKTRYVSGPAVHLYHLPGHAGDHLTDEDRAATAYNKFLLDSVRRNVRLNRRYWVRDLMAVRA